MSARRLQLSRDPRLTVVAEVAPSCRGSVAVWSPTGSRTRATAHEWICAHGVCGKDLSPKDAKQKSVNPDQSSIKWASRIQKSVAHQGEMRGRSVLSLAMTRRQPATAREIA